MVRIVNKLHLLVHLIIAICHALFPLFLAQKTGIHRDCVYFSRLEQTQLIL